MSGLLEEKKNFVCQVHDQQRRIEELTAQVRRGPDGDHHTGLCVTSSIITTTIVSHCFQSEKDQAEMKELRETVEQQSKTIKRFNRGESEQIE